MVHHTSTNSAVQHPMINIVVGMMEVWKTQPFEHIKTFGADVKDKLRVAVGLLPNGQYLMSGNDLALIDANNNVVRTWAIPKSVYCIDIYYPPQVREYSSFLSLFLRFSLSLLTSFALTHSHTLTSRSRFLSPLAHSPSRSLTRALALFFL